MVNFVILFILEAQVLISVKKKSAKTAVRKQVKYQVKTGFQVHLPRHRGSIYQLPLSFHLLTL